MSPIRRELLNGLFVLVVASLLSTAFSAFQVTFNLQLWVLILMAVAIAVSGYVLFEIALGVMASGQDREKEWLKRVGTPARLELNQEEGGDATALFAVTDAVKSMRPGSDYTVMHWIGSEGGMWLSALNAVREKTYSAILERLKSGAIREYKRIISFDHDVLANDSELKSGVLRVGEGPGTIDRRMGEHCRVMMETKGCSLYVAPALLRLIVVLYGDDKISVSIDYFDRGAGGRRSAGIIFFCDPPNGDIVEQFRQMERATERRMVAVHKILFPEDEAPTANPATR